jgi:hypothetical protein
MKRLSEFSIICFSLVMGAVLSLVTGWNPIAVSAALYAVSFIPAPRGLALEGVSTWGQRVVYANAVDLLAGEGVTADIAMLTQGYLRFEQPMVVGQTNILFPVLVNQSTGGQFNTENRLNLQDAFVTSEIGLFLYTPSSATATNVPLISYPNTTLFATAGSAAAAETIYHSYLTLSVNKQVVVPFWDVWRSRLTNQTQQAVAIAAGTVQDQLSGRDHVFYPTEPNWIIIGSRSNILTLVMPNQFAAVTPFSRIVIFFRGFLAQNCTSVQ